MKTANKLHIAAIQTDIIWENPEENRLLFEAKINALSSEIDLVVLPEMFTTAFTINADKLAEKMDGKTVFWLKKIASEKKMAIIGSIIICQNNNFYNRLLFVHPSGKIDFYDKRHSFTLAKEEETYTSGTERLLIDYKGWKICPLICYDLRFPVWSRNTDTYDLLIYVASWPKKRVYAWDSLLKARAIENMSYTVGVNRIGIDAQGFEHNGHSIILDTLGAPLSESNNENDTIIEVVLDKEKQDFARKKLGFLNDRDTFEIS